MTHLIQLQPAIYQRVNLRAIPALACLVLALTHAAPAGSLDDVFVVLTESRAWAMGEGPSGAEGATSLLDVAWKALQRLLLPSLDPLVASGWAGVALLSVVAASFAAISRRWGVGAAPGAAITLAAVMSPGLVESAGYLLEGPLFAVLWTLTLIAAAERRLGLTAALAIALAAARPEALLLAPLITGWAARGMDRRQLIRGLFLGAAASCAVTATRLVLYGDVLPNTFYAKSSDSRWLEARDGAAYVAEAALSFGGLGVGLGLLGALVLRRRRPTAAGPVAEDSLVGGLVAFAGLYALIVVASGGDSYEGARLFMPVSIPVWLALAAAVGRAGPPVRPGLLATIPCSLIVLVGAARTWIQPPGSGFLAPWYSSTIEALRAGPIGLEAFRGDDEVFARIAAGLGPNESFAHRHTQRFRWFEPDQPVLDLTGLTDRDVARLKAPSTVRFGRDAVEYALEKRAGAIHLDPVRSRPTSIVDADLVEALSLASVAARFGGEPFLAPELAREVAKSYVAASLTTPGLGGMFNLLVRRDLRESFSAQGFRVGQ